MNQTVWIDNFGNVIPCDNNGHYRYIAENFQRLYGRPPANDAEVHDLPYNSNWVHIQNHYTAFNIRGNQDAIRRQGSKIRNMIFERLMDNREFSVNIEYNNKAMINPYGSVYSFKMPDQFDQLRTIIN